MKLTKVGMIAGICALVTVLGGLALQARKRAEAREAQERAFQWELRMNENNIEAGMSADEVRLAWGEPLRVVWKWSANEWGETWIYPGVELRMKDGRLRWLLSVPNEMRAGE